MTYSHDSQPAVIAMEGRVLDWLDKNGQARGGGKPWRPAPVILAAALHGLRPEDIVTRVDHANWMAYCYTIWAIESLERQGWLKLTRDGNAISHIDLA